MGIFWDLPLEILFSGSLSYTADDVIMHKFLAGSHINIIKVLGRNLTRLIPAKLVAKERRTYLPGHTWRLSPESG
jgi:hypothetical protein